MDDLTPEMRQACCNTCNLAYSMRDCQNCNMRRFSVETIKRYLFLVAVVKARLLIRF